MQLHQNTILKDAIIEISDDTKFIRLATVTTFLHSLLFILYIIYLTASLVSQFHASANPMINLLQTYVAGIFFYTWVYHCFSRDCVNLIYWLHTPPTRR